MANNPIAEIVLLNMGDVPTIVPMADHTTIMRSLTRNERFSPSVAYSVTLSISGASLTVPSLLMLLGKSPRENISATSPTASSTFSSEAFLILRLPHLQKRIE